MKTIRQFLQSIKGKITIGIVIAILCSTFLIAGISSLMINSSFTDFLETQEEEGFGYGRGRNQSEDRRLERYNEIISDFEQAILTSLIISSIFGLLISIFVGFLISNRITRPLSDLGSKLKSLRVNNFEQIKNKSGTYEIIELTKEYNSLIDELKRIEKLREDMVSDVAHELKTPLTKILGQLEGCIDGVYECDKDHLEKVIDNVHQLKDLINSLQEVVEIRSTKYNLKLEKIQLYSFLENILSGYHKEKVRIINKVPKDFIINADKLKLREIIDNLVSNSLRYTSEGSIEISLDVDKNIISISDTGIGISKNDLPYIFERFFRADKSRNKATGGFGLGLAIVKDLVDSHGWQINVESKPNQGTTFNILIS